MKLEGEAKGSNATSSTVKQFVCSSIGWFGEAIRQIGPELASRVLKTFHVDSWECGSQNWTPGFRDEFEEAARVRSAALLAHNGRDSRRECRCLRAISVRSAANH